MTPLALVTDDGGLVPRLLPPPGDSPHDGSAVDAAAPGTLSLDAVAMATLICSVRELQETVARLTRRVSDLEYRESV